MTEHELGTSCGCLTLIPKLTGDAMNTYGPGPADPTEPPLPARPYLGRLGKLDSLPMREQAAIAITIAARKERKPHLFCDGAKDCFWQTRSAGAVDDGVRVCCPRHPKESK